MTTEPAHGHAAIIGFGLMGCDIAAIFLAGGWRVTAVEPDRASWPARLDRVTLSLGQLGGAARRVDALDLVASLDDVGFGDADVVVEAVPEKLELKQQVFRDLDAIAPAATIFASNTSGFPIGQIAEVTQRPELVIGWHWASPPLVMRLAEIVRGPATSDATVATIVELATACNKNPVVIKDSPDGTWGFVANRVYMRMIQEANACIDEGIATREQVDALMVDCFRWPVGPFGMVQGASSGWGQ